MPVLTEDKIKRNLTEFNQTNHPNLELFVNSWKKLYVFETATENGSTWFLIKSSKNLNGKEIYEKRFKIEKLFQDSKSSGFDIEKSKIKKYDRFKRIIYISMLSHMFCVMLGNFLETKTNGIKKNFALFTRTLLAYSLLDLEHFPPSIINPLKSSES